MATVNYKAVLADLEEKKRQIESAIRGIEAILQLNPSQQVGGYPVAAPTKTLETTPRRTAFGRDPSQPTLAERIAVILKQHGPLRTDDIRQKLLQGGRAVSENVVRDVLTRKDKTGQFKKTERGVFALSTWRSSSGNGTSPHN